MWAAANRIDSLPDFMVGMGGTFLGGEGVAGADVVDMNYRVTGEKKSAIMKELDRIAVFHEKHTLPTMKRALEARSHSADIPPRKVSGAEPGQTPLST
jgi:hypothetical protein